jgi:S-layer homology domain
VAHTHTRTALVSARSLVPAPRTRSRRVSVAVALAVACIAALVCLSSGAGRAAAASASVVDAATVVPAAAHPAPGDTASFWVIDWGTALGATGHPVKTIEGVVKYVGAHVVVYVQQGRTVPDAVLTGLGEAFDLNIYPSLTGALGSAPDPGVDGEPRITVMVYDFGDGAVKGYFNRNDIDASVPLGVGASGGSGTPVFSNHREMVSINLAVLVSQPPNAGDSAAHEFAHLLTYYHGYILGTPGLRVPQKAWIDEGIATYAEVLAGYGSFTRMPLASFGATPDKNVTIWGNATTGRVYSSDYGASCALIGYLVQIAQPGFLQALVHAPAEGKTGVVALQDALDGSGTFLPFADLFDDWVAANFLTSRPAAAAPYAYALLTFDVQPDVVTMPLPAVGTASVQNFGAVYLDLPSTLRASTVRVVVDGEDGAPLHAALLSWDTAGLLPSAVTPLALSPGSLGGRATSPAGYDHHTLVVWARGSEGVDRAYRFGFSAVADPVGEVQFLDVGSDNLFVSFIDTLVTAGVVSGFEVPPGSGLWYYRPGDTVTRRQFAKMVVGAVGLHTPAVDHLDHPTFTDVPPTDTGFDYIEEAAAAGIVQGYPGPVYKPDDAILRIQLLHMILRSAAAVGHPFPLYDGNEAKFADVPPGHEFYREVMTAYKLGIINGSDENGKTYFHLWDVATRGHVAKMTATFMECLGR